MLTRSRPSRRSGFTLLEVMVVVVILGLLASMIVPRMTGATRRKFEVTVDQVSGLLSMFAHRESLQQRPVGIRYDDQRGALELVTLEERDGVTDWTIDHFVKPVVMPREVDADAIRVLIDGGEVDIRGWPYAFTPGSDRPMVEIVLRSIDGEQETSLVLQPFDIVPKRIDLSGDTPDDRALIGARRAIDLDAEGRSREDW